MGELFDVTMSLGESNELGSVNSFEVSQGQQGKSKDVNLNNPTHASKKIQLFYKSCSVGSLQGPLIDAVLN